MLSAKRRIPALSARGFWLCVAVLVVIRLFLTSFQMAYTWVGGAPLDRKDLSGAVALVMGSERYGISREWYEGDYKMIAIPMAGSCDSLNVGVAATVLAYEAVKKNKFLKK